MNIRKLSNSKFVFVIISKYTLLGVFDFNHSEMLSSSHRNNAASCELFLKQKQATASFVPNSRYPHEGLGGKVENVSSVSPA